MFGSCGSFPVSAPRGLVYGFDIGEMVERKGAASGKFIVDHLQCVKGRAVDQEQLQKREWSTIWQ